MAQALSFDDEAQHAAGGKDAGHGEGRQGYTRMEQGDGWLNGRATTDPKNTITAAPGGRDGVRSVATPWPARSAAPARPLLVAHGAARATAVSTRKPVAAGTARKETRRATQKRRKKKERT